MRLLAAARDAAFEPTEKPHSPHDLKAFLEAVGHPDELSEPSLAEAQNRQLIFDGLVEIIGGLLAERSREDVLARAQASGLPSGMFNTPLEFVRDRQLAARGALVEVVGNPLKA